MTVRAETEITLVRTNDGDDGYSPTATVTKSGDTATITITDKNGTTSESVSDGEDGAPGISVTGVQTQYYLSSSNLSPTDGEWADEQQEFVSGMYYWTRDKISYSNGTVGYSTAVYAQGLTLANEYAIDAQDQARSAYNSASSAIKQLSVVEDIVGVLELISKNGEYELTRDMTPIPDKWYFVRQGNGTTEPYWYDIAPNAYGYELSQDTTVKDDKTYYTRSGSGTEQDPYVYTKVEPEGTEDPHALGWYEMQSPASLGYYELIDITSAVQNYVSSHLVLTNEGMNLQNEKARLLLSATQGLILYEPTEGAQIARYGAETVIGDNKTHVKIAPTGVDFVEGGVSVANVASGTLVIKNARIDHSLRMGNFVWAINPDGRLLLKYSSS